jgi:hypothetical protein
MGLSASLFLTGRVKVCLTVFGGLLVVLTETVVFNYQFVGRELAAKNETLLMFSLGGTFLVGTAWTIFAARLGELLARKTALAAAVWVVLSMIGVPLMYALVLLFREVPTSPPDPASVVFLIGLFSLPAAPFALAPLALAWNRHR